MAVTDQPLPRRRRTVLTIAIIASFLVVAAVVAAWQFGRMAGDKPAAASPTALPVETQIECTNIRREYAAWNRDMPRLVSMVTASADRAVVRFELDRLRDSGDALFKAVSGYPDQPSKALASATAQYRVDLGFVSLEHQLQGGKVNEDAKQKAVQAAGAVQTAYKTFMQKTCGEPS